MNQPLDRFRGFRSVRALVGYLGVVMALGSAAPVSAQTPLTWSEIHSRFEAANPTLQADQLGVDESKAMEITAFLRPNPACGLTFDQIGNTVGTADNPANLFSSATLAGNCSYLHERQHKRELRRDQAKESTIIAESTYLDQERSLVFNLRNAFVQLLQAKAVLENAKENLAYWDRELAVNRKRFKAGDLALVDLNRLELQRVQFEADFENAIVSLRTSKIQLLTLLNARTPIDQFDVTGQYDFTEQLMPLEEFRDIAVATRPDLKAAAQSVDLAKITHQLAVANGSTDPTFSAWWTNNPSFNNPFAYETLGFSVSIPLRIFDRNQGEK